MKLDFSSNYNPKKQLLSIKKLKVNYFFSHSHKDVDSYLKSHNYDIILNIFIESKKRNTFLGNNSTKINMGKRDTIYESIEGEKEK